MKNRFVYLAIAALCLVGCGKDNTPAQGGKEEDVDEIYLNPVYDSDFPDPTVWREDDGWYYAVCTQLKTVIKSNNLTSWYVASSREAISDSDRNTIKATYQNIYAPQVCEVGGERLLYAGLTNSPSSSAVGVFKQDKTTKIFKYIGIVVGYPDKGGVKDSIDPDVVTDENGRVWLFFGSTYGIHRIELNKDGLSVKEGAELVRVAGKDGYSGSTRENVFEGAYLYRHGDYWYLFVSAGSYNNAGYKLLVGRSKTIDGEFVGKDGRKLYDGYATRILYSDSQDSLNGPGHNGEIFVDKKGRSYMFYHSHTVKASGTAYKPRKLLMQEMFWDSDGWPYFEGSKPQVYGNAPKLK